MWTVLSNNPGQVSGQSNQASILLEQYKTVAQPVGQFILQSSERQALPQYCLTVQDGLRLQQTSPFALIQTGIIVDVPTVSYGQVPLMDIPSTRNKRDTTDGGITAQPDPHPYQTSNQIPVKLDVFDYAKIIGKPPAVEQPPSTVEQPPAVEPAAVVEPPKPVERVQPPQTLQPQEETKEEGEDPVLADLFNQISEIDDFRKRLDALAEQKAYFDLLDLFNTIPALQEEDPQLVQYINRYINLLQREKELKKIQPSVSEEEKAVVEKGIKEVKEKRMDIARESTDLRQKIVGQLNKEKREKARKEKLDKIREQEKRVEPKQAMTKLKVEDDQMDGVKKVELEEEKKPSKLDDVARIQRFHDQIKRTKGKVTNAQRDQFLQLMNRHKPDKTIVGSNGSPMDKLSKKSILDQLQTLIYELEP